MSWRVAAPEQTFGFYANRTSRRYSDYSHPRRDVITSFSFGKGASETNSLQKQYAPMHHGRSHVRKRFSRSGPIRQGKCRELARYSRRQPHFYKPRSLLRQFKYFGLREFSLEHERFKKLQSDLWLLDRLSIFG